MKDAMSIKKKVDPVASFAEMSYQQRSCLAWVQLLGHVTEPYREDTDGPLVSGFSSISHGLIQRFDRNHLQFAFVVGGRLLCGDFQRRKSKLALRHA